MAGELGWVSPSRLRRGARGMNPKPARTGQGRSIGGRPELEAREFSLEIPIEHALARLFLQGRDIFLRAGTLEPTVSR